MKKNDSQIIKGIAILAMIFYHLFSDVDMLKSMEVTGVIFSNNITAALASAGHVCVSLFIFVTSYGLAVKSIGVEFDKGQYVKESFGRYFSFLKKFWWIYFPSLIFPYVFRQEYNLEIAFGEGTLKRILGFLGNLIGLPWLLEAEQYNKSWWYIGFFFLLLFIVPLLIIAIKKVGGIPVLVLSVLLPKTFQLDVVADRLPRYIPIVILALCFAQYSLFEKIFDWLKDNKKNYVLTAFLLVMVIPCYIIVRQRGVTQIYLVESLFCVVIVLLAYLFIGRLPWVNTILSVLGKHSLNMWLLHTFLISYWGKNLTFSFRNMWLIYAFAVFMSLMVSVLIEACKQFVAKILKKTVDNKMVIFFSVIMVLICYLIMKIASPMVYLTNDDSSIQNALSGMETGEPDMYHQFICVIPGFLISTLYKIIPCVQWWYVYSVFLIGIGMFLIHLIIFRICQMRGIDIKKPVFILIVIDMVFMLYPIANVSFTIVPAILGTGLVSLILIMEDISNTKQLKWIWLGLIVGYIAVVAHRSMVGLTLLCYILLAILYYMLGKENKREILVRYAFVAVVFLLLTGGINVLNSYENEKVNGLDFVEYNSARVKWMDYPKDTYYDNPGVYEKAGWTEEDYQMASGWGFISPHITADSFDYISEHSVINTARENKWEKRKITLLSIWDNLQCRVIFLTYFITVFITVIFIVFFFNWREFIILFFNNVGTFILFIYQLLNGRMVYRSIIVFLLPATVFNIILILKKINLNFKAKKIGERIVFIAFLCILSITLGTVFSEDRKLVVEQYLAEDASIVEFVTENKDNIYICGGSVRRNINPDLLAADVQVTNLISWGGSGYNSARYKKQLNLNDISTLSGEVFQRENVYFLSSANIMEQGQSIERGAQAYVVLRWLKNEYNAKGIVMTDTIEGTGIGVYQYIFEGDTDKYDIYYDIVDGCVKEIQGDKIGGKL